MQWGMHAGGPDPRAGTATLQKSSQQLLPSVSTPRNLSIKLSHAVGNACRGVLTPEQALQCYTKAPTTCTYSLNPMQFAHQASGVVHAGGS